MSNILSLASSVSERHTVGVRPPSQTTGKADSHILYLAYGAPLTVVFIGVHQWARPRPQDTPRQDGGGLDTLEEHLFSCVPLGSVPSRCEMVVTDTSLLGHSTVASAHKHVGVGCGTPCSQALPSLSKKGCMCLFGRTTLQWFMT